MRSSASGRNYTELNTEPVPALFASFTHPVVLAVKAAFDLNKASVYVNK